MIFFAARISHCVFFAIENNCKQIFTLRKYQPQGKGVINSHMLLSNTQYDIFEEHEFLFV